MNTGAKMAHFGTDPGRMKSSETITELNPTAQVQ